MEELPLISIIIPTYNRANLILETLESIQDQTYTNWECIVVDDGSTDTTKDLLSKFIMINPRFFYYQRPLKKPKGANSCRNYGLQLVKGEYVIFFDSDDLMTPNHLMVKLKTIQKYDCKYVIAKTAFFNHPTNNNILETNYKNNHQKLTPYKFVSHVISWQTPDACIKRNIATSIQFNEELQSGQEYNYFSKLCLTSTDTVFIDKVLTLRRYHSHSIRARLRNDRIHTTLSYFYTYWHTYNDTKNYNNEKIKRFLLYRCLRLSLKLKTSDQPHKSQLHKNLIQVFGLKGLYYIYKLRFPINL